MLGKHVNTHDVDGDEVLTAPGVTLGWRGWRLSVKDLTLYSPDRHGFVWPSGEKVTATYCHVGKRKWCNCGINAFKNRHQLAGGRYENHDIIGEVKLWGTVDEYSEGYRAKYAYPSRLWVDEKFKEKAGEDLCEKLAAKYGIPVAWKSEAPEVDPSLRGLTEGQRVGLALGGVALLIGAVGGMAYAIDRAERKRLEKLNQAQKDAQADLANESL